MNLNELQEFGTRYAKAWSSQDPERVAAFYAEGASLRVNGDPPAVGRQAIADVARGFMSAFPDMELIMDDVVCESRRTAFHWTLTGTSSGPGGKGKRVRFSGHEEWQIDASGLIAQSQGHFDTAEYERQLAHGVHG